MMPAHRIDSSQFRDVAQDRMAPASRAMLRAWEAIKADPPDPVVMVNVTVQSGSCSEATVPRQHLRRFISRLLLDDDVRQVVVDGTRLPL